MAESQNLRGYAAKMRRHVRSNSDLEADARFVDMLAPRGSTILDIGCGIGSAVNALRRRGHDAFGLDPSPEVLDVAIELHGAQWFRSIAAADLSQPVLTDRDLPSRYDLILMSGNVPAFLTKPELASTFQTTSKLLTPGGRLVIGTSARSPGGPKDQDAFAEGTSLALENRYCDWHLGRYDADSPWSVSVFTTPGRRRADEGPDGMFVL
ncbi:MAG: class I SAM-dependent methyltransferase [Brevibacterium sp.]|uniref:class I SAM-dependent methyltransferase n=1 Tax=Brevibacterium sandarakinum TaxID=629680 RepID=UPI00265021AE|nr:class I SAM-dependent methyltransferase [Brevibacterium sandarakinum]MDN5585624.1 class I SAM-dependent methyltransferase [Brevibacterium sp.]MDN5658323.1 class I SAM-dependent methyltransferase [Brevibacterium sandarakinum]MDN6135226.1 class I SAM-dependent methyltransferase [Brevibacterium sp.]MDN6529295.1 class I SAM-dependent methyltransferase [Brevibacterium sp.]